MWQQLNCSLEHASWENPSGCNGQLFSWVEVTVGAGTDGATQPANFSTEYSPSAQTTGEGSSALGFYNVQQGDAPYFNYLANNYAMSDNYPSNMPFTIPPSTVPSIGDSLIAAHISWKYYGDMWNAYVPDPYDLNYGVPGPASDEYCTICNPFQYDTSIMANSTVRQEHIQDTVDLYADITNGTLPAVSIVKPSGLVDGHPASSKLDLFEGFVRKRRAPGRHVQSGRSL
jgi:phospholipase C